MTSNADSIPRAGEPRRWPLVWRLASSVVLAVHVLSVFVGPFAFATSSGPGMASPFAAPIRAALRPYLELAFLDHGYFFFAPNPGPSHLLRARLDFADERPPRELTFPDRQRHWPRLLYHRHFMLAEQLHADFIPAAPPPDVANDPVQNENWRLARSMYELRKTSFEQHLRRTHQATGASLTRVEHALVAPAEFALRRQAIDAPETYLELSDDPPPRPVTVLGTRP